MRKITHILLAGDRDYDRFLLENRNKCLLEFSGKRLLEMTLAAFSSASLANALVVIGPSTLAPFLPSTLAHRPVLFLEQRNSLSENVHAALEYVEKRWPGNYSIFVTNDAPLLTGAELDSFAKITLEQGADINIAVTRILSSQLSNPLVQQYVRSMVIVSEGIYLLGNQVALSGASKELLPTVQTFFDNRKQSHLITEARTLLFALGQSNTRQAIFNWLRMITAKKVWMLANESKLSKRIAISLQEVEIGLNRLLSNKFDVRVNDIPDALGCFDADTTPQLRELRTTIEEQLKLAPKKEAAHG